MSRIIGGQQPALWATFLGAMVATSCSALAYVAAVEHISRFTSSSPLDGVTALYRLAGFLAPVSVFVKGTVLASVIWAIMMILDYPVTLRACLASVWAAEPLLAMPTVCFAAAAFIRGATRASDLIVPLGADAVWNPGAPAAALLSHSLNVFTLAWPVAVWLLLRRCAGPGPGWRLTFAVAVPAAIVILLPVLQFTT